MTARPLNTTIGNSGATSGMKPENCNAECPCQNGRGLRHNNRADFADCVIGNGIFAHQKIVGRTSVKVYADTVCQVDAWQFAEIIHSEFKVRPFIEERALVGREGRAVVHTQCLAGKGCGNREAIQAWAGLGFVARNTSDSGWAAVHGIWTESDRDRAAATNIWES